MKKFGTICLLCCMTAFSGMAYGCSDSGSADTPQNGIVQDVTAPEGTFDIEVVRKNINVKGYHFEVPMKLKDLDKGLRSEFVDSYYNGLKKVSVSDDNGVILETTAENAQGAKSKAIIYNIVLTESDGDIDGIVPTVTVKDEVVKHFGEPDEKNVFMGKDVYSYGPFKDVGSGLVSGKNVSVTFNDKDVVETITITYADQSGK